MDVSIAHERFPGRAPPVELAPPSRRLSTFTSFLVRLAGVDYDEALRAPGNEQKSMALVGASLLLGAVFQAICIWVALGVMFGSDFDVTARAIVTTVATGVMFVFDSKFVAGDWQAQGLAYCRARRGLVASPSFLERLTRPIGVAIRWMISYALAALIATFVMLLVFRDDIDRTLQAENKAQNIGVLNEAKLQFDRRVREINERVTLSDRTLEAFAREREALQLPISVNTLLHQQIETLHQQVERWRAARVEAERALSSHSSNRNAEEWGIRRPGNTGKEGVGREFQFHDREIGRLQKEAVALAVDIETGMRQLSELRREASGAVDRAELARTSRLAACERAIVEAEKTRVAALAERAALQDDREGWIDRRVRTAPAYKPVPTGLSDRLRALLLLTTSSALVLSLMTILKLTVMMLEGAGPIAKVFFAPASIYAMRIALRAEDATDQERERREELRSARQRRQVHRELEMQAFDQSRSGAGYSD